MSKIVHTAEYEWAGYNIAESAKGHILTMRSQVQGCRDNVRILVPFNADFPAGVDFEAAWNEHTTYAEFFYEFADKMPGAKVLQSGHVVC